MPKKERVKSLENSNVKKIFDEENKKWRRLCSRNGCKSQARKDGICARHLNENRSQQRSATSLEVSHQTSALSTTEEFMDTTSNSSSQPVALEENHIEHKISDKCGELFSLYKLLLSEQIFIFTCIILENTQTPTIQTHSTNQNAVLFSNSNQPVPVHDLVHTDQMNTCHSSITILSESKGNPNESMAAATCKYVMPSVDNFQCRQSGRYTCAHCQTPYCLNHGTQHQKDLKKEIEDLLDEAKVSHVHLIKETSFNS
jgi:hypothetical protein